MKKIVITIAFIMILLTVLAACSVGMVRPVGETADISENIFEEEPQEDMDNEEVVEPTQEQPTVEPTQQTETSTQPQEIFDENGMVFPDSNERYLTDDDLSELSVEMLGFARNEIFARYGNIFNTDIYRYHYEQYSWYNATPKQENVGIDSLNEFEVANVELIQVYEANLGVTYLGEKVEDGQYEEPCILAKNSVQLANGQNVYVALVMENGYYTGDSVDDPRFQDAYYGLVSIQVYDDTQKTLLSKVYPFENELYVYDPFDFYFADYNGDGNPEFLFGQYGMSVASFYQMFTIDENGIISVVPGTEDFNTFRHGNSILINQPTNSSVALVHYSNSGDEIGYFLSEWAWNGTAFEQVSMNKVEDSAAKAHLEMMIEMENNAY